MAGIGFALERLVRKGHLTGISAAYVHATFLTVGPWLFTALAMAGISALVGQTDTKDLWDFRSLLIYNFLFSLVLTGPIALPLTRFVSDELYARRTGAVASALTVGLALFALLGLLIVAPIYMLAPDLSPQTRLAAHTNFMLVGACWVIAPMLSALNGYKTVSFAFLCAMTVAILTTAFTTERTTLALQMNYNVALAAALVLLASRFTRAYGTSFQFERRLFTPYIRYWELPAIGLAYNLGIWIDKIVMWFAAPAAAGAVGWFPTLPDYDAVMFWAQLTAIPVIAVFFVDIEPDFYRLFRRFYFCFEERASLREAVERMEKLGAFTLRSIIRLLALGVAIALTSIIASYPAIEYLGLRPGQAGMLRVALIGVVFQTTGMFCLCFLLYFDLRRQALAIAALFVLLNGALTAAFLPLGTAFYGYGYFISTLITFIAGLSLIIRELPWLHYHAFVTNNAASHSKTR